MEERHTAENLAATLKSIIGDWHLSQKVRTCVRDNVSNQVAAGRLCPDWDDLPCFAHTLQLAVKEGFVIPEVNSLIKKSVKLVKFFKKSAVATSSLGLTQERLKIAKHRLIQSCKTRWNSVYEMFNRLFEQKQSIQAVLSDRTVVAPAKEEFLALNTSEWNRIDCLLPVLSVLQLAPTAMSQEQNISVSCILPDVTGLRNNALKLGQFDSDILREFKRTVSQALKRRFLDNLDHNSLVAVASCLDPRHKGLKILPIDMKRAVTEHVKLLVSETDEDITSQTALEEPPAKKSSMMLLLGEDYYDEQQALRDEYTSFLEEYPLHPNEDPLKCWKMNEARFPKIAVLARQFLFAPSTSVPSERVFSVAGNIVNKKRSSLLSENVSALIFLNKNIIK